jgi:hypothetical protein
MKKILPFICFCSVVGIVAQDNSKKKDTVKTEVVEIETRYNPKIADANKIVKKPTIKILEKSKRKKLEYSIFSAPVASTFVPKTGVVKGIDVGVKERIFNNFVALGYGNYASPYAEMYFHYNSKFENAFGLHLKYSGSQENLRNSVLNSTFSNIESTLFYSQNERFYKWKTYLSAKRNSYNWYGLPDLNFSPFAIGQIEEQQNYNQFNLGGEISFDDSKIEIVKLNLQYFNDAWNSSELYADGSAIFKFPVDFLFRNSNEISISTRMEYLRGRFQQSYSSNSPLDHHFLTLNASPKYQLKWGAIDIDLGTKLFLSFDMENDLQHFLVYPDLKIQFPIVKDFVSMYGGISGGLTTNNFASLTEQNPFVSPTLFMTQTNMKYHAFSGLNALATNDLSIHLGISRKNEEDKPLFIRNNSKSDGATTSQNGIDLKGFEYGNSFSVIYDDVITMTFFGELEYEASKYLSVSTSLKYHVFDTRNSAEAWNLPNTEASILAKFKKKNWYGSASINYFGDRKDALYSGIYPSNTSNIQTIAGFMDANLNGGYHFNDKFTVFVKMNNFINGQYQQFANFDVQGFQAILGLSYKFDF